MLTITADLDRLNADLALYAKLARMSMIDAVIKRGTQITIGAKGVPGWYQQLKTITPPKGNIRTARLAALAAGSGIRIRPAAYRAAEKQLGKRKGAYTDIVSRKLMRMTRKGAVAATTGAGLNLQALAARRELAMRERGRGFTAYGSTMRGGGQSLSALAAGIPSGAQVARRTAAFRGRYRQQLSMADLWVADRGASAGATLRFGGAGTELGISLTQARPLTFLRESIQAAHADMMQYIQRKLTQAKGQARLI